MKTLKVNQLKQVSAGCLEEWWRPILPVPPAHLWHVTPLAPYRNDSYRTLR